MRRAITGAVLLTLAACSSAPREELPLPQLPQRAGVDPVVAARAEGLELRAVGDGFLLEIFRTERIRLTLTESGEALEFPKPEPRFPAWNGSIYDTAANGRRLRIEIRNFSPCAGGGPGVEVRLDDREFAGCGSEF